MISAALLAFALSASAQSPLPYSNEGVAPAPAPAVSTAPPAVAAEPVASVVVSTESAKPAAKAKPRLHAVIHAEAKNWEPLSVREWGDPSRAETRAVLRQEKIRGRYRGIASKAQASARLHKAGKDDRWLVVCVFPKELERRRRHFEVRLKIVEGFVEDAKAAVVSVVDRRPEAGAGLDSFDLRAQGVAFEEDSPASGSILISALDPRPSRAARNSGTLKLAAFAVEDVGLADASWSVKGISF